LSKVKIPAQRVSLVDNLSNMTTEWYKSILALAAAVNTPSSGVSSASFVVDGNLTTPAGYGQYTPVLGEGSVKIKTGTGISITDTDNYSYFSGLSAAKAYEFSYLISFSGTSVACDVELIILDSGLTPSAVQPSIVQSVSAYPGLTSGFFTGATQMAFSGCITGVTDVVLGVGRYGSPDPIDLNYLGSRFMLKELGAAV